jgi:hypothetical protein
MPTQQTLSRLAITSLLITTIAFSTLYIDLTIKHDKLEEDYTNQSQETSTLKKELAQIEHLHNLAKGPNNEYTSYNLVLAYSYWFNYYQDSNHTSGNPYICVYIPDDNLTFELFVEAITTETINPHLTIQKGTPDMDEPLPDLFIGPYVERFHSFTFNAPSAGWYTVSLVGHITPNFQGPGSGGSWHIGGNLYEINAQLRILRSNEAVLFGIGAGS